MIYGRRQITMSPLGAFRSAYDRKEKLAAAGSCLAFLLRALVADTPGSHVIAHGKPTLSIESIKKLAENWNQNPQQWSNHYPDRSPQQLNSEGEGCSEWSGRLDKPQRFLSKKPEGPLISLNGNLLESRFV